MSTRDSDKTFAGSIPDFYESYLVPLIFEPYASDLAARLTARHPTSVLEIAAGTGVVTRAMAAALPETVSIIASDLNQPMLDCAASRSNTRSVQWRQADAMNLPFDDEAFDAVVCQFGVMFFPDRPKAYAEARRVLKPGGMFLFNAWDRIEENEFADAVTTALQVLFPTDPPRFLARTPHGYHDVAKIAADLNSAGFGDAAEITRVSARSRAASSRDPAIAYCHGTPLRNEIEARSAGGLDAATDLAAEAIGRRFGRGAVDGKIQANVVVVTRSVEARASRGPSAVAPDAPAKSRTGSEGTAPLPQESPPEIYERYMVPAIFDAWVPAFLDLAAPEPGERMLDLACGTGVVARQAVSRVGSGGRLVGLDFNAGMLARARASEPAVEWQEGNAMALPFADDTFDVVVCQQALQFFPDAGKALEEVRRVLAPAGRFVAAVWCEIESSPGHHALARALERHVSAEAAGLMYSVFRLGDAQALEALLSTAGFQQVSVQRHQRLARFPSADAFARWVIVGSVLGRTGVQLADVALSAIVRDVTEALEPFSGAAGLIFPMEANLASARAPA